MTQGIVWHKQARTSDWIIPEWEVPANVHAIMTTRFGGVSEAPFDSFNLGSRCGDTPEHVERNREMLRALLPAQPTWLKQVHGTGVLDAGAVAVQLQQFSGVEPEADASFTCKDGVVCAVLVADCMPVLLADRDGGAVAAAHAGWRGMSGGVIESTIAAMGVPAARLSAWLGPAIGPENFEVGDDVRQAFLRSDSAADAAFRPYPGRPGKFLCDLAMLARQRLARIGVTHIAGGQFCTVAEPRFYSYRRDRVTGRMGAFIWMEKARR